jgi:hypothetical protein
MATPTELLKELDSLPPGFWGSIELLIQDGEIVVIKKTCTTKIKKERNTRHDYTPLHRNEF